MSTEKLMITPSTKVAALLDHYPELEETIIAMAPPFKKLKNPILRKSVAKVASLRQAAAVGGIPVEDMVNQLRAAVGQPPIASEEAVDSPSYFTNQPDWFDRTKIVLSIDEQAKEFDDVMPVIPLLEKVSALNPSEIVELITTHLPVPGIDLMRNKGFVVWAEKDETGMVRTYFAKPATG